jgi:hypothetical protein
MRLRTQCRSCGLPFPATIDRVAHELAGDGWSDEAPRRVEICPLCGCKHLYRQRDMHRAWGCALVALGAALVPWTYGLSLVALGLLDFWLHRRLRNAVVCYRCDTVYRDAVPLERQGEFDLLKHDVLKYGKSWAAPGVVTTTPSAADVIGAEDGALLDRD